MNSATQIGLTVVDSVEGRSVGITRDGDGWLALTLTESRTFKTANGAARWMWSKGYRANGTKVQP